MYRSVVHVICSSEADYEDFDSTEHDEVIHSDGCSEENGKHCFHLCNLDRNREADRFVI